MNGSKYSHAQPYSSSESLKTVCGSFSSSVNLIASFRPGCELRWPESCVEAAITIVITVYISSVTILSSCFLGGEI